MHANAPALCSSASPPNGDVNRAVDEPDQTPKSGGAAVAYRRTPVVENRLRVRWPSSHRENGCHATSLGRESYVANAIHTAMQMVQPTSKHAGPHRIVAHPDAAHLGDGDHSMLTLSRASDQSVGWDDFSVHFTDKSSHPIVSPPAGRLGTCCVC